MIDRRMFLAGALALPAFSSPSSARENLPTVSVTKDPSCGCCSAWAEHLRQSGFTVSITESTELNRVKARLGVPKALASCHTAEVGGYVIEGHVPADEIKRLLVERPAGKGLAVPGMPIGSPGMEVDGASPDLFEVILFDNTGQRVFARYRGALRA